MGNHVHQPDFGTGEKSLGIYSFGILLCVVLTLIPFWAVMHGTFSRGETLVVIFISALLQFLVQVVCFLRLNYSTEQSKMNVLSFYLAILILFVIVGGSLWIMWSLRYNMMH